MGASSQPSNISETRDAPQPKVGRKSYRDATVNQVNTSKNKTPLCAWCYDNGKSHQLFTLDCASFRKAKDCDKWHVILKHKVCARCLKVNTGFMSVLLVTPSDATNVTIHIVGVCLAAQLHSDQVRNHLKVQHKRKEYLKPIVECKISTTPLNALDNLNHHWCTYLRIKFLKALLLEPIMTKQNLSLKDIAVL